MGELTAPIQVNRGNIQGDSLSPFLFLIYIEPLLRWLQVGGRGYMFGCLDKDPTERVKNALSNAAFADDLSILTSKISDLHAQAGKLSEYSDWARMHVNNGKTTVSGVLYRNVQTKQSGTQEAMVSAIRAQLNNQVFVQGQSVAYLDPRAPFRYLGAWLTATLDWKHQHQDLIAKARDNEGREAPSLPCNPETGQTYHEHDHQTLPLKHARHHSMHRHGHQHS